MTHPKYEPPKGSLAYRIIEYMKGLPPGKQIASGPLAEAMGQPSSAVITALLKPEAHGLVVKERVDGFYRWRLGDGVPLRPQEEEIGILRPKQVVTRVQPASKPVEAPEVDAKPRAAEPEKPSEVKTAPQPVFDGVGIDASCTPARPKPEPEIEPEQNPMSTENRPLRFGWWNDGELTLIKGKETIILTPEEGRKLLVFLTAVDFVTKQTGKEELV